MAVLLCPYVVQRFADNNNNPLNGGLIYTYIAGTATPQATYTDSTGAVQNTNPVVCNARGEASIWLTTGTTYDIVLTDASGNTIWTAKNISSSTQIAYTWCGVATGTANALTLSPSPAISSYGAGLTYNFQAAYTNTGNVTVSISGLAPIPLLNNGVQLNAGDLVAGYIYSIVLNSAASAAYIRETSVTNIVYKGVAGGAADAITASLSPTMTNLVDGLTVSLRAAYQNATAAPTFAPDGLTAYIITKSGGTALSLGDIPGANAELFLKLNLANTRWELLNVPPPAAGYNPSLFYFTR